MVDIVSVVLSVISILQGIKNETSLQSKCHSLKMALTKTDEVYELLSVAKKAHDEFQTFQIVLIKDKILPLVNSMPNLSRAELEETTKFFLKTDLQLITTSEDRIPAPLQSANTSSSLGSNIPHEINKCLEAIPYFYEELHQAIAAYDCVRDTLKKSSEDGNFGKEYEVTIRLLDSIVDRILTSSDRLILNSCPVLDYIHCCVKNSVEDIL